MEMLVRILGLGSEWWVRPGPDRSDPLRFTKHAAYFNTTAFPHGAHQQEDSHPSSQSTFHLSNRESQWQ